MIPNRLLIIIIALITGFLVADQFVAHSKVSTLTKSDDFRVLAVETAELIKNTEKLEQELNILDEQKQKLEKSTVESKEALSDDINRLKIIAATTPVSGEGIEINFDKALDVSELTDLVNGLRNIGAEAIAIGERRIATKTGFQAKDGDPPVKLRAIGKRDLLKQAVSRRGGILEQIGHGEVKEIEMIDLPAVKFELQ